MSKSEILAAVMVGLCLALSLSGHAQEAAQGASSDEDAAAYLSSFKQRALDAARRGVHSPMRLLQRHWWKAGIISPRQGTP